MPLIFSSVAEPISFDTPVGRDIRAERGLDSPYFKLKDARAQARMTERNAETSGEPVAVPAEWATVRDLAVDILTTRSKDVEVGAWLMEAMLRLDGFKGLAEAATVTELLIDRFWPDVHSIDEDDAQGRLSPLAGLNGLGGEGALIQPIRMVSLLPDGAYGSHGLWHASRMDKDPNGDFARTFREACATASEAVRERARQAAEARDALARLVATLDARCGADAPPSSNIRNVLDDVVATYQAMLGDGAGEPVPEAAGATNGAASPAQVEAQVSGPRELRTREDAFVELLRIADFFRRSEPHSPIADTLTTLVMRGRMSFVELIGELLPDASQRKQMLNLAGIRVDGGGQS